MHWKTRSILCIALLAASGGGVAAQEYCVACNEPPAVYRCVIENAQPGGAVPLPTLCVNAMAKAGGHVSCALKKGTVFDCQGPVKRVPWTASATDVPAPLPPPVPANQAKSDPKEPPKTVEELANRANKQSSQELKKAGETIKDGAQELGNNLGRATKKTFDCVVSFFSKC